MYVEVAPAGTFVSATPLARKEILLAMARTTKEEALETKNRLLDAAETVFHRDGFARTTLAGVAEAANVTRGAVYWHFKNKSDLFNAMCERVRLPMEEMSTACQQAGLADPLAHLRRICVFFLQEAVNNPHSHKVFDILFHKCEFVERTDPVFIRNQEAQREGRERLERLLINAVSKEQLPAGLDARLASIWFQSNIEGILSNWLFEPERYDLAVQAERLVDASIETLRCAPTLRNPA
jgi:TetR/AcrR family acrAB operon transcriptional repressor